MNVDLKEFNDMQYAVAIRSPGFNCVIEVTSEMDIELINIAMHRFHRRIKIMRNQPSIHSFKAQKNSMDEVESRSKKLFSEERLEWRKKMEEIRDINDLEARRNLIIEFLTKPASSTIIRETLGLTVSEVTNDLKRLVDRGKVEERNDGMWVIAKELEASVEADNEELNLTTLED